MSLKLKSVEEALKWASFYLKQAGVENPRMEAEVIFSNLMKTDRLKLCLNRDLGIDHDVEAVFQKLVARRSLGEPTAYITGEKYFYGNRFMLNSSVLIPRPETELIIDCAIKWAEHMQGSSGKTINCLDLGTGSGILAVTLALRLPEAQFWAVDISAVALETAKHNASVLGVKDQIVFLKGSYFEPLAELDPKPQINLVVSNPPYIRKADFPDLPAEVRFEPIEALYGGEDGLDAYRAILGSLPDNIKQPALLLLEIGAGQQQQVEKLCLQAGCFHSLAWAYDLAGHPRVLQAAL